MSSLPQDVPPSAKLWSLKCIRMNTFTCRLNSCHCFKSAILVGLCNSTCWTSCFLLLFFPSNFFPVARWGHRPQIFLNGTCVFTRTNLYFYKPSLSVVSSSWAAASGSRGAFATSCFNGHPHRDRGCKRRERVEGWERRAHAWACHPPHEQVKTQEDGLAAEQFICV